jgi:hypothetical protein
MSFYTSLSENLVRIGSFAPPVFKAAIMVLTPQTSNNTLPPLTLAPSVTGPYLYPSYSYSF